MFSNFLPLKVHSIPEESEDTSTNSDSPRSLHLWDYGDSFGPPANWRLQFSMMTKSTHTTPVVKTKYGENRTTHKGKSLSYILPTSKQGKISASIVEVTYEVKQIIGSLF